MKILDHLVVLGLMLACSLAHAQEKKRSDYVSDASFVVGTHAPQITDRSTAAMAKAAEDFMATLDGELRNQLVHKLTSDERRQWTNLPAREDAGGLALGKLNEQQLKACCNMMATFFSEQGYAKMCNIMLADDQLLRGGRPRPGFGTETFSVVIFGLPDGKTPWAFQLDGHHIGVNLAFEGENISMSPSFIGTQPEAYKIANESFKPLSGEVEDAYRLIGSLNDDQKSKAVVAGKRGRILAGPGTDGKVPEPRGVECSTFDDSQKKILLALIAQWVNDLPEKQARSRMKQLESEIDKMRFAWHGPTEANGDISYAIQGPTLIVEYACQDLGGNPRDHLHTMYRDPTNEYGKQLD